MTVEQPAIDATEIIPAPARDAQGRFLPGHSGAKPKGARDQIASMLSGHLLTRLQERGDKGSPVLYLHDVIFQEDLSHEIRLRAAEILLRHMLPKDMKVSVENGEPRDIHIAVQIVQQQIDQYLGTKREDGNASS